MSKSPENQDSGLFVFEINNKPAPKKRGRKPLNRTPEQLAARRKELRDQHKKEMEAKKVKPTGTEIAINNIILNNIDMDSSLKDIDIKDIPVILAELEKLVNDKEGLAKKLNVQELKFIDYHYRLGLDIKDAMSLAGYKNLKEGTLYLWAKKIREKYEAATEDKRIIMRALGFGEIFAIQNMAKLATSATSEVARAQATTTLGKWLELDKGITEGGQGVTVIIQGPDAAVQINTSPPGQAPAPQQAAPYQHPTSTIPGKPITIIK